MYAPGTPNHYPAARQPDHHGRHESDSMHEQLTVHDSHNRPERNTEKTKTWMVEQVAFAKTYLDQNSSRQKLEDETRRSTDSAKV